MIETRQQAYLDALGIPVWSLREASAIETPLVENNCSLKLGPGRGGILLICATDTDSASKLANDISRALGKVPVWSWPDDGEDAVKPAVAVDENLFTTVAVFGTELAEKVFGSELPVNLNSASLVLLPSMRDLESRAEARQSLWADLCRSGMVSAN
jgi:DNA polymerase III psi subunit